MKPTGKKKENHETQAILDQKKKRKKKEKVD
jgi:hypothetical protein